MVEIQNLHCRRLGFTPWMLDSDPDRTQRFQNPALMYCVRLTCEQKV